MSYHLTWPAHAFHSNMAGQIYGQLVGESFVCQGISCTGNLRVRGSEHYFVTWMDLSTA
jgi:hypothetical protein